MSDKAKVVPFASFDFAVSEDRAVACDFFSIDDSPDMVNEPPHYKDASGIECIEVTKHMQFCGGNCFKYLYRAGKKSSTVEDLKKAAWYAERAKQKGEFYSDGNWAYLIREIARYRSNDAIHTAMIALRWCRWSDVVVAIKAEIARLESEDEK